MQDRSKWWKLRRRAVVLIAVVLAAGALIFGWSWYQAGAELRAAMAEAAADDPHWQLVDIEAQRKVIPDSENGALVILEGIRLATFAPANTLKLLNTGSMAANTYNVLASTSQRSELSQIMRDCGPTIAELRKLRHRPIGRFPFSIDANPIPGLQRKIDTLQMCRLLRAAMNDGIEARNATGAFDDLIAMIHIGRAINDEPSMLAMSVRVALDLMCFDATERLLATCTLTDEQLEELQRLIEVVLADPVALWGMRGERAGQFYMYDHFRANPRAAAKWLPTTPGWQSWRLFVPGVLARYQVTALRKSNEFVAIAQQSQETWLVAATAAAKPDSLMDQQAIQTASSMARTIEEDLLRIAKLRALLLAVATERYRVRHDRWPDSPAALVADGLLPSLPVDPFIAKPLGWEKSPTGLVITGAKVELPATDTVSIETQSYLKFRRNFRIRLFDSDKRRKPGPRL